MESASRRSPITAASAGQTPPRRGRLQLRTLGDVRVRCGSVDYTERMGARHRALLVFLVFEGRPVYPSEILELLGRGGSEASELGGLKRALAWLDENLPGLSIDDSRDSVVLGDEVDWDVHELDEAIDRRDVQLVASLYTGDFLEGFETGSRAFDDWAVEQRRQLRDFWDGALKSAALECEHAARWPAAARWWRVLVDRHPLAGGSVARLMRAYGRAHDRESAAKVYAEYLTRLQGGGETRPARPVQEVAAQLSLPEPVIRLDERSAAGAKKQSQAIASGSDSGQASGPSSGAAPTRSGPGGVSDRPPRTRPAKDAGALDEFTLVEPPTPAPRSAPRAAARPVVGGSPGTRRSRSGDRPVKVTFGPPTSRAATSPSFVEEVGDSDGEFAGYEGVYPTTVARRAREGRASDGERVFTHSVFVYGIKTLWARLTTPRARGVYRDLLEQASDLAEAAISAFGVLAATLVDWAWAGAVALTRLAGSGLARARAAVRGGVHRARGAARQGRSGARHLGVRARHRVVGAWSSRPRVGSRLLRAVGALASRMIGWPGSALRFLVAGARRALALPRIAIPRRRGTRALLRPRAGFARHAFSVRRLPRLAAGLAAVLLLLLAGPIAREELSGLWDRVSGPELTEVSLPRVSVPKVRVPKVSMPDVSVPEISLSQVRLPKPTVNTAALKLPRVPGVLTGTITRLNELLAGPLLDEGMDVIVADLQADGEVDDELGRLLALVIEAELSQARYFSVIPRERALTTDPTAQDYDLPVERAVVAASWMGAAAVVGGRLRFSGTTAEGPPEGEAENAELPEQGTTREELDETDPVARVDQAPTAEPATGYLLTLFVIDRQGRKAYEREWRLGEDLLLALPEATRALAVSLGEPIDMLDEVVGADFVWNAGTLTPSLPALTAYADARAYLYSGRYGGAAAAARAAVRVDSAFAAAYQLLAQAEALRGRRSAARRSLESAYRFGDRLSERERRRVLADREVFARRYTQAILAYERLFQLYRDDATALKSLAILQRMIGARGRGEGNLQLAYRLDPVDWPPLERIAGYLGYRGRTPRPGD